MANRSDEVTIRLSRAQAAALAKVADTGLRVTEALGLVQSTAAAERAIAALNAAIAQGRRGR